MHSASLATRAELALEDRDFATARDALRNLHSVRPKQIATTRMLLRAERGAGAWDEVLRLANQLGKRDAIAPALAEEYKVQAMIELLGRSAADEGAFERRWRGIEAKDRIHPRIAAAAARHATELGKAAMAREILERALAAEWSPQLLVLYAELPGEMAEDARTAEARERIERAESWLLEHARDAQLLAALGPLVRAGRALGQGAQLPRGERLVRGEPLGVPRARPARRAPRPAERRPAALPPGRRDLLSGYFAGRRSVVGRKS
jgi:HemY protein